MKKQTWYTIGLLGVLIALLLVISACVPPQTPRGQRALSGKASGDGLPDPCTVTSGTCQGFCGGGPSTQGNCYCDDVCADYGDCCPDKQTLCGGAMCTSSATCGNGVVQSGETCTSCPSDVKCPSGTACVAGQCVAPNIAISSPDLCASFGGRWNSDTGKCESNCYRSSALGLPTAICGAAPAHWWGQCSASVSDGSAGVPCWPIVRSLSEFYCSGQLSITVNGTQEGRKIVITNCNDVSPTSTVTFKCMDTLPNPAPRTQYGGCVQCGIKICQKPDGTQYFSIYVGANCEAGDVQIGNVNGPPCPG